MGTKEYKLLDGRTIRAKYNRLGRCNISKENLESFVKEFNASYRQAKILEKIKENYALMKADEHKKLFNTEKSACEFLGVRESSVSCSWRRKCKCKGWNIIRIGNRAEMDSEQLLSYADQDTMQPAT